MSMNLIGVDRELWRVADEICPGTVVHLAHHVDTDEWEVRAKADGKVWRRRVTGAEMSRASFHPECLLERLFSGIARWAELVQYARDVPVGWDADGAPTAVMP